MDNKFDYTVLKIFNNNTILVSQGNNEKILLKKGIGFNIKPGSVISKKEVLDKVFILENDANIGRFEQLINHVDYDLITLCEEIIDMICEELNENLDEKIHISLTDHIAFTLKRLNSNFEIDNPFLVEISTLYNREFQIAEKAVRTIETRTNTSIPDGEIGFIALHIHAARNKGKLSNTIKYTFLFNSIIELIEDELNIVIDTDSLNYARFLTHLRFAIERTLNNTPIKNELLPSIKKQYKSSYKLSKKVSTLIEKELNINIINDEVGYIAIHIEKFKSPNL